MTSGKISFSASGVVTQDVTILVDGLTVSDLVKGLQEGLYLTTMQGDRIINSETLQPVAIIEDMDTQLEYVDFESEG
jgi:hypothetical protein